MTRRPLTPFENMDIRTLIDGAATRRGDHPFLIWEPLEGEGATWSYRAFAHTVQRFAAGLHARGVAVGDRILVHLDNCPESVIAWLGCAYAGAVAVTTNAKSALDELQYFAEHSGAIGAITQPRFAALVAEAAPHMRWRVATDTDNGAPVAIRPEGFEDFAAIDDDPANLPERPHDPWAHFAIQYTSGTTARPKAVLWSHANALWGAKMCATNEGLGPEDVHLVHLPLFHTNAQSYSVLSTLWAGGTAVLMPRFSASRFWPISLKHKATWTSLVPFCAKALMGQPVPPDHHYRLWGSGVCSPPFDAHFGVKTIGWWGMTETITHGTVGWVHHDNAPMSMGRPAPGYAIHVLDELGNPVPPGGVGELCVGGERGVSLFLEYFRNPEATASAFREDGLFITGDRVMVGPDGWLYFADRSKDMLKVGGENVAASEIERVIAMVPGVSEVAVVAMRHDMLDEVPAAFIIADPDAEAGLEDRVAAACNTTLAAFKRPHHIRLVDSLPRSTLEKIAKAELRAMLDAEGITAKA